MSYCIDARGLDECHDARRKRGGSMTFLERYIQFLNELEMIDKNHDGLTDTDVRERLHGVINYYFTWGNPIEQDIPRYFFMPTPEGDKEVFKTLYSFIIDALICANEEGLNSAQSRHEALENPMAVTSKGNSYDLFLGSSAQVLAPEKPDMGDDYGYFDYE
jgi:hypothetical protein